MAWRCLLLDLVTNFKGHKIHTSTMIVTLLEALTIHEVDNDIPWENLVQLYTK